ncbi:CDC48 family AAA ATPase [Paenibacillus sp. FSL H8-0168]|uniref:CDC48 family AAA ATPase n=1 Tax=Paenibacillus sp. FSL H8-0168 TaxID=2921378 RepID=UPI0031585D51
MNLQMEPEFVQVTPVKPYMLCVIEDRTKNEGHGIVRMNQADMVRLGLSHGDIVVVTGKRQNVALLKLSELDAGEGEIQMDGILRKNVGVDIGEQVHVTKVTHTPARNVTLIPSSHTQSYFIEEDQDRGFFTRFIRKIRPSEKEKQESGEDIRKYRRVVAGLPTLKGERICVELFGRSFDFKVVETVPEGVVVFNDSTVTSIIGGTKLRAQGATISYEDIGGLSKEVSRVREMVELPLRYPQLFEQLGVDPPRGLLLYGPPGCGKTLIARTVAQESGVYFIHVNGPEIIQQHYGESEQMLRRIFEDAQEHSAAIIFFDEIDALAPNRDTVLGDMEKRVVAQLLALMDGLTSRGRIIVIAATNLPNNVDPALRRPGRFDREIGINSPDKEGRLEILNIHTRKMLLADDVHMERVAAMTHGFLGADLAALCREAVMVCIREAMPRIDFIHSQLSGEQLADIKVSMKHFDMALNEIELSTIRQVSTEVVDVRWQDIGGLEEVKDILREAVELPLKYSDRFEYAHTRPPKGILLTGAPGTGKTLMAKAVATESEVNFISVKGPELLSKWVGESERGIREIFKKARQSAPSIIFFDEIDAIVPARGKGDGGSQVSERMVGQFLLEMDNIEDLQGVLILAATNRPDLLDKALLRPGRFDFIVELPIPDYDTRLSILQVRCQGRALGEDVSFASLAKVTEGMTGADLEALCQRSAMLAIKESIEQYPEKRFSRFHIEQRHFDTALRGLGKFVSKTILE